MHACVVVLPKHLKAMRHRQVQRRRHAFNDNVHAKISVLGGGALSATLRCSLRTQDSLMNRMPVAAWWLSCLGKGSGVLTEVAWPGVHVALPAARNSITPGLGDCSCRVCGGGRHQKSWPMRGDGVFQLLASMRTMCCWHWLAGAGSGCIAMARGKFQYKFCNKT